MKIGIYGYGNLGRGVECAVRNNPDIQLSVVFTRRKPEIIKPLTPDIKVESSGKVLDYKNMIDVLIICGGSASDLPVMTPFLAGSFNVVDSFDTHAKIPGHMKKVDAAAKEGGNIAVISAGWDPGLFSLARLYSSAVLPKGKNYTFWGSGVSQGHSDAVRKLDGVIDARQYTVPVDSAVQRVKNCEYPELSAREKHKRICYVAADPSADKAKIEREIKAMPDYFSDYDTSVFFITEEEMKLKHSGLPHGGSVIRTGMTGADDEHSQTIEYNLKLASNPEFTAGVLIAFARAAFRMNAGGFSGCKTVFDIPPAELSPFGRDELIAALL